MIILAQQTITLYKGRHDRAALLQEGMQEGCLSAEERDNSIEAVQEGDTYLEDVAAAASVARSGPGAGAALEQQLGGLPGAYHAALAAMAEGVTLERSASAGSERNADARRNADEGALGLLAAALGQSLQPPWPGPGTGQSSWVSGQGAAGQAGAGTPPGDAGQARHAQGGFNVPALPANSPFLSLASRYPAVFDAVMRSDHGLPTPAAAHAARQELANALSPRSPAPHHSHGRQPERVASTRLPGGVPGTSAGADGALPVPNGGSNEPSDMPRAAGSNENRASQQSMEDFMQQRLYTAGSLARPAEGELRDPSLAQERQSGGSPAMELMRREDAEQPPCDFDFASPRQAGLQLGRAIAQQEAHSGAAAAQGRPAGELLHGADSGAMPALSIIRGLSGPFPTGFLPGHASAAQRRALVSTVQQSHCSHAATERPANVIGRVLFSCSFALRADSSGSEASCRVRVRQLQCCMRLGRRVWASMERLARRTAWRLWRRALAPLEPSLPTGYPLMPTTLLLL